MPNYPCDLHTHTNRSDGSDTPKELIDRAAGLGMAAVAITDHDIRPPATVVDDEGGETDIREYARRKGLCLLPGIEVSCETDIEDTHVVGLGCDWSAPYFRELEVSVVESKLESYRMLVDELRAAGMDITWPEVLDNDNAPVAESGVQKKMIFELLARKGYAKSWSDAKRMVKNTPRFRINRRKPAAAAVIAAIREAGGVSILAHPYLIADSVRYGRRGIDRDAFISALFSEGLNGIEASYTYDKTSYGGSLTKEGIARAVADKYGRMAGIISGGSDYHADHKKGVASPREIGEAGVTLEYFSANPLLQGVANSG